MPICALSVSCAQLTRDLLAIAKFLYYRAILSRDICPPVSLFVTRRYSIETAKHIIKLSSPSGSHANKFLHTKRHDRHLRSATLGLLDKPRYELETYGRRAFSYAGPSAWNSLPAHLRSQNVTINNFRHSLKTFLFSQMIHAAH